jgi:hypothetical protein
MSDKPAKPATLILTENAYIGGRSVQQRHTFEGVPQVFDVSIPIGTAEKTIPWKCRGADLLCVAIHPLSHDVTIEPDAGRAIELRARNPYIWRTGGYYENLLAGDITTLTVRCDVNAAVRLKIVSLEKQTAKSERPKAEKKKAAPPNPAAASS